MRAPNGTILTVVPDESSRDPVAPGSASGAYAAARIHDPGDHRFEAVPTPAPWHDKPVDECLLSILRIQGFDELPAHVSERGFDRLIERGWRPLWRGIADAENGPTALEINHAFTAEKLAFVGQGVYGSGHYFATDLATAAGYAGYDGRVIRAALNPKARLIDVDAINTDRRKWLATCEDEETRAVMSDVGRFAACRGYDAITIPRDDGDYLNVLNRTALAVEV